MPRLWLTAVLLIGLSVCAVFWFFTRPVNQAAPSQAAPVKLPQKPPLKKSQVLLRELEFGDLSERSLTASRLAELNDPETVDPLIRLLRHKDASIREGAASALGEMKEARALEPLMNAMSDSSVNVRRASVHALQEIGDLRAAAVLVNALHDPQPSVRADSAWALGLLFRRADDKFASVAVPAATAEKLPGDAPVERMIGIVEALQELMSALNDPDPGVRAYAALALGWIRNPCGVESLIHSLHDAVPNVRAMSAFALGEIRDPRAVPELLALTERKDTEIQYKLYAALARFDDPSIDKLLMDAYAKRNWKVLSPAVDYFIRKGNSEFEPILIETLTKTNEMNVADSFFRSDSPRLKQAAQRWAEGRDLHFEKLSNGEWGWREMQ